MLGHNIKKKINIFCLIILIVGTIAALLFSDYKEISKEVVEKINEQYIVDEFKELDAYIDEFKEDAGIIWAKIMDELHGKKILCDYCGGYTINKYDLEQIIPDIYLYATENEDRIICEPCRVKAMIKIFDKVLKPKYLKKRLKE